MDRTPAFGSNPVGAIVNTEGTTAKVELATVSAHQTTDKFAHLAAAQVDRLSGAAHRGVNVVADVAKSTAQWAATVPERAIDAKTQLADSACAAIRARPLSTVAGALAVGYLLGRIARL